MRGLQRQTSHPKSKTPDHEPQTLDLEPNNHKTLPAGASGEEPGSGAGSQLGFEPFVLRFRR